MQPASLGQFASFFSRSRGRIGRREYGLGDVFVYALALAMLAFLLPREEVEGGLAPLFFAAGIALTVAMAMPVIKRCHDIAPSGAFVLLLAVPVAGLVRLVALLFLPGTAGPNLYGIAPQFRSE